MCTTSLGAAALHPLAGVVAVVAVVAGTALAAFPDDNVTTYTGCLLNGNIISVKAGDSPTQSCKPPPSPIKLSGGDITSVNVQAPLKQIPPSTGLNGKVTIGLDSKATLPTDCSEGQLIRWRDTNEQWVCRDKYAAGNGLDLTSDKTFSLKTRFQLPQGCSDGGSVTWDGEGETWYCQQYVKPSTCTSGQFATGANSGGTITCAAPSAVNLSNFDEGANDGGIPSDGAQHDFVDITINANSAGKYLVIAKGVIVSDQDASSFNGAGCSIRKNSTRAGAEASSLSWATERPTLMSCQSDAAWRAGLDRLYTYRKGPARDLCEPQKPAPALRPLLGWVGEPLHPHGGW